MLETICGNQIWSGGKEVGAACGIHHIGEEGAGTAYAWIGMPKMHADGARPVIPFGNSMPGSHIGWFDPALDRQSVTCAEIQSEGGRDANVAIRPHEIERLP